MPNWQEIRRLWNETAIGGIYEQVQSSVRTVTGVPIISVDRISGPQTLTRADQGNSIHCALGQIYTEGERLGAINETRITDDVSAVITSTFPASAHTPYFVSEQESRDSWHKVLDARHEHQRDRDEPLMVDDAKLPMGHVPAQLITWTMLRLKTGDGPEDFAMAPVDMYQLAHAAQGNPIKVSWGNQTREIIIPENTLRQIYTSVQEHLAMHEQYLLSVYKQHIVPEINRRMRDEGIDISLNDESVRTIAHTMALGYARDLKAQWGVGGGAASNPTGHIHTTLRPNIDAMRRLILHHVFAQTPDQATAFRRENDFVQLQESSVFDAKALFRAALTLQGRDLNMDDFLHEASSSTDVQKLYEYLKATCGWGGQADLDIHAIQSAIAQKIFQVNTVLGKMKSVFAHGEPVLGGFRFEDVDNVSPHMLFKQVDPYATMFHEIMDEWVQRKLGNAFHASAGEAPTITSFHWDKKEYRFDMRVTEGWEIRVPQGSMAEVQVQLNAFLAKMNVLWQESQSAWEQWKVRKDETLLCALQKNHNLPDTAIDAIKRIHPTDQQLRAWIQDIDPTTEPDVYVRLTNLLERRTRPEFRRRLAKNIVNHRDTAWRVTAAGFGQIFEGGEQVQVDGETNESVFNKGLNIPGRPSFGIFYEHANGGWIIRIHPLMGEKALAETEGTLFERRDAK